MVVQPILELKLEERRSLFVSWKKKNKSGTGAALWHNKELEQYLLVASSSC